MFYYYVLDFRDIVSFAGFAFQNVQFKIFENIAVAKPFEYLQSRTEKLGQVLLSNLAKIELSKPGSLHGVSAKTFEPNNSVIFQRIFVKFKMQIF
jgi:hypothetical protein